MTEPDYESRVLELYSEALGKHIKVACLDTEQDISEADDAVKVFDKTMVDMKGLFELKCANVPTAMDSNTWLLMGALNLAHRLVRLERDAATQTRNLEETLNKLLDDATYDAIPNEPETDFNRSLPLE